MGILRIDAADGENVRFGVGMPAPIDDDSGAGEARRNEARRQRDGPVIMAQRLILPVLEPGNFTLGKPGIGVIWLGFQGPFDIIRRTGQVVCRDLYTCQPIENAGIFRPNL